MLKDTIKQWMIETKGKFVTIDGRPVFIGGPGQGGGSASAGGGIPKHNVKLPANPKKLDIDTSRVALEQMGFILGKPTFDLATQTSIYDVTTPDQSVVKMEATELRDFIYDNAG